MTEQTPPPGSQPNAPLPGPQPLPYGPPPGPPPAYGPPPAAAPLPQQYMVMQPRRSAWRWIIPLALVLFTIIFSVTLGLSFRQALLGSGGQLEQQVIQKGNAQQVVAVYSLKGLIDGYAAQQFAQFARDAAADPKIKAIVLRIDSPGGGVTASDEIWAMVKKLKDGKQIVVSMGGLAASGGYYVAAPAHYIFAEETTMTGSIGVIMQWYVVEQGLTKIGVEPVTLKSTNAAPWKDELSMTRMPDERQRAHLQTILDKMQARFEKVVKEGRPGMKGEPPVTYKIAATAPGAEPITVTETPPFNGKIYLGPEAKDLGLVDEIGYLSDAIAKARTLAAVPGASVVLYEPRQGLLSKVLGVETAAQPPRIDAAVIDELTTPRVMMLWKP